jgi:hypothetical protein
MSDLTRLDFIELGVGVPTDTLVEWASGQLAATKGREGRLHSRGLSATHLAKLSSLIGAVGKPGSSRDPALPQTALVQRLRAEALGFWREAQQIAKAEFGTKPDVLAKFRRGVLTGLLLDNLIRELESVVALFRQYAADLSALGGDEAFVGRGVILVGRLRELKSDLDRACMELPAPQAQKCHDKGLLYDLTRKLVRVGRLEFAADPASASAFNFSGVKRGRDASAGSQEDRAGRAD